MFIYLICPCFRWSTMYLLLVFKNLFLIQDPKILFLISSKNFPSFSFQIMVHDLGK